MVSANSNRLVEGKPSKKGACPTGHAPLKKEGCHLDNQSSINLKSNTMKNTMQRYGFSITLQTNRQENALRLTCFICSGHFYSTYSTKPFKYSPSGW